MTRSKLTQFIASLEKAIREDGSDTILINALTTALKKRDEMDIQMLDIISGGHGRVLLPVLRRMNHK